MSDAESVLATFDALLRPSVNEGGRTYSAAIVGPGALRVAKSGDGRAALLVPSTEATRAPILTRYLRADFGAHCRVREGERVLEEVATVIECLAVEPAVTQHFLLAVGSVLTSLSAPSEVGAALNSLIEMFRAMTRPPRTSVQGLWGELFVIARSADPLTLIRQWHVSPYDRHDFAEGNQRVEVKTAGGAQRRHRFSQEQLRTPEGDALIIASLMVESSAAGATIADLIEQVTERIGTAGEPRLRMLAGVADALGTEWEAANQQRYDTAAAAESLRFFLGDSIPTLSEPLPPAISDVRFTVDLSNVATIDSSQLQVLGGIFADVAPVQRRPTS